MPEGTKLSLKTVKKAPSKRKKMPEEKRNRKKLEQTQMQVKVNRTQPTSWIELRIMQKFKRQWNDLKLGFHTGLQLF